VLLGEFLQALDAFVVQFLGHRKGIVAHAAGSQDASDRRLEPWPYSSAGPRDRSEEWISAGYTGLSAATPTRTKSRSGDAGAPTPGARRAQAGRRSRRIVPNPALLRCSTAAPADAESLESPAAVRASRATLHFMTRVLR